MFKAYVVTDPMCSWCWGMASAVEEAAHALEETVTFDLLLGGINTHGTQPIGEFGRRHLLKIWREVADTTAAPFGFKLPDEFVYNSTLPCVAVEAVRRRTGLAPFGFLHRLQQAFFVYGENINNVNTLDAIGTEFGWAAGELARELEDPTLARLAQTQFESSRGFGTNALPNVLIEPAGERRLLLGGYADSSMLCELLRQAIDA